MTTSIVYHTQGIRGFHYKKTVRKDQTEYYHIISTATEAVCPCCKSVLVLPRKIGQPFSSDLV